MSDDAALVLYQREVWRTGGIVLGAEPLSKWRPHDAHLRAIVDGVDILHDLTGAPLVDVGVLADLLRADDEAVEWASLLLYVMHRWDDVQEFLARWAHAALAAKDVFRFSKVLVHRVDRLERAREAAEKSIEALHAACDAFEGEISW